MTIGHGPPRRLTTPSALDVTAVRASLDDPERVTAHVTDRLAMANDASHYLLTPELVVTATSAAEVARLIRAVASLGSSLTFRSGGTSLSGQASTDRILVDTRRGFRSVEVLDDGRRVRVEPGATLRQVNAHLVRHGRRLGPDPASEGACTVGGVIANNSSGMTCGTAANAYCTMESVVLVLADGLVFDSAAQDADALLRARAPAVHAGLGRLRDRIRANPASVATIRRLFAMKNTLGYGLNSFLDYDEPAQILTRLTVGSEGTLAFVASAVMRTVPLLPHARTGLLLFEDMDAAARALPAVLATTPTAAELLDAGSLRVAESTGAGLAPAELLRGNEHACALLVEYQGDSPQQLRDAASGLPEALRAGGVSPLVPAATTDLAGPRARLWHARKGLYAAVAAARAPGTSTLLEDVVVPPGSFTALCGGLTALLASHGYPRGAVFGHAKDGNVHFLLTDRFAERAALTRLDRFTQDLVDLVLGLGGSLKAEHGTGRMMAPFVERQYGAELFAVMQEVKGLLDPAGVLNPGVLIAQDDRAHLRDLKPTAPVADEVDLCTECGFCEPVCPSRDLTLTPRRRIVLRREMAKAAAVGDRALLRVLESDYAYQGDATCAVDGMCATACPVGINTGDLVKQVRTDSATAPTRGAWQWAAGHWDLATRISAAALDAAARLPSWLPEAATMITATVVPGARVPRWSRDLPRGGTRRAVSLPATPGRTPTAVLSSSCTSTLFAPAGEAGGASNALVALCSRAGADLRVPPGLPSLCCGTPWRSKGVASSAGAMTGSVLESLWVASEGGALPVVCDASSCTVGLREVLRGAADRGDPRGGVDVLDGAELVLAHVLPALDVLRPVGRVVLHPTCSSQGTSGNDAMVELARGGRGGRRPEVLGVLRFRRRPGPAGPGADDVGHGAGGR